MKQFLILSLTALLLSCSGGKVSSLPETWETGQYDQLEQAFTERTEKLMKKALVKGISIAVVDDQQMVWATGFGLADVKNKIPANKNTVYRFGSVTKLFTAVAIMDLVEQDRINLNDPVQIYIPELKINAHRGEADTIRVRHLLTHHSGLQGDRLGGFGFYEPLDADYHQGYLEMPELLSNDFIQFGPDSVFAYCNNAFTLLGVIINRVTGMDYSQYMQQEILDPMEMENSSLIMTDAIKEKTARGYHMWKELEMPYIRDLPAGSLLSSTADMSNFMKMIFNDGVTLSGDTLLNPETLADMFVQKNAHVPLDKNFKIGWTFWLVNPYDHEFQQEPAGHGGDLPPYHAILIMLPGEKLGVTAVTNSNTGASMNIQLAVDVLKAAYEIKTGESIDYRNLGPEIPYDQERYRHLEGYYPGVAGLSQVKAGKKGLEMSMGSTRLGLTPHAGGWYSLSLKLFGFLTLNVEALDALAVNMFEHGGEPYMELTMGGISTGAVPRIQAVEIPVKWLARTGKYKRVDDFTPFTRSQYDYSLDKARLRMDKKTGFLLLEGVLFGSPVQLPLEPLNDHTAVVMGVGRMGGQTLTITQRDGEEVLQWSGMEFKKR